MCVSGSSRPGKTKVKVEEVPSDEDMLAGDDNDATAMQERTSSLPETTAYDRENVISGVKAEAILGGVKDELALTEPVPADVGSGSTFYEMRPDCLWTNPMHRQAREDWRASVIEALAADGKMAVQSIIRFVVNCCSEPSFIVVVMNAFYLPVLPI